MRRKRSKRKKVINKKTILYITAIAMLNLVGIGYAMWNEGLYIFNKMSTGKMDVRMYDSNFGNITKNDKNLTVAGEVYQGDIIELLVINKGTIGVKLNEINQSSDPFTISLDKRGFNVLEPWDSKTKEPFWRILLEANDPTNEEIDFDEIEFFFKQYNE